MVLLDLLTIAGIPTAVGASEAVHQQQLLDEEAEAPERQEPFYLDVYCDAQSRKKDEVHGAIIVLKDGKVVRRACEDQRKHTDGQCSSDYGPSTPRQAYRKQTLTARKHPTPSRASFTRSLPKTLTCHTHPCPRLLCSAS